MAVVLAIREDSRHCSRNAASLGRQIQQPEEFEPQFRENRKLSGGCASPPLDGFRFDR
jgi:hypothetical protein